MTDVIALGESLIDFSPYGKSDSGLNIFEQNPGGAPANVLATVSKMGGSSAFIGKVGDDQFGKFLKQTMESSNIDCSGMILSKEAPTTLAFVHLSNTGDRSFSFYRDRTADLLLDWSEIDKNQLKNCKIFHFGSLSLISNPCKTATIKSVKTAKKSGAIISYDPNYRPLLWTDEKTAVKEMLKPLPIVDLLKVSEEELELLTGTADLEKGADKLLSYGISFVAITLGEKGSYYATKSHKGYVKTINVDAVDTTGSGDAFWGTLLYQLKDMSKKEIASLTFDELERIVKLCNVTGSLTATKKGAIPAIPDKETATNRLAELL